MIALPTSLSSNHPPSHGADNCVYPTVLVNGQRYYVDHHGIRWGNDHWREQPRRKKVQAAQRWIQERIAPIQIKTPAVSAYRLKHAAERWHGSYISTGALILAAARCGIPMRVTATGRVLIAVSLPRYRALPEVQQPLEASA